MGQGSSEGAASARLVVVRILLAGFRDPGQVGHAAGLDGNHAAARLLGDSAAAQARAGVTGEGIALGVRLTVLELPPSYARAALALREALSPRPSQARFDHFLLLGTDPGSSDYKLHVLAANYADHGEPDADGTMLQDTIIDPDGPVAYRSRLPLDGIWDKLLVERIPVRMSHKAPLGLFNHAYYTGMRIIDQAGLPTRGGAIETPPLPGDEVDDAEPRTMDEMEDVLLMVLSVLAQLYPAGETPEEPA